MVPAEVGKLGEPRGWVGRKKAQVAFTHWDLTHPTVTRVSEKHPWLCSITLKSVPVQTGPLTGTTGLCVEGSRDRKEVILSHSSQGGSKIGYF